MGVAAPGWEVTIQDDDIPHVKLGSVAVAEGDSGVTQGIVPVLLDEPAPYPFAVAYQLTGVTATAGIDCLGTSGWIRFESGQNTNAVRMAVLGDTDFEPNETVRLRWTDSLGGGWTLPERLLAIRNDDPPPAPAIRLESTGPGAYQIAFDTVAGGRYRLQFRENLLRGTWQTSSDPLTGTGGPAIIPIPRLGAGILFLRIRVE